MQTDGICENRKGDDKLEMEVNRTARQNEGCQNMCTIGLVLLAVQCEWTEDMP